MGRKLRGGASWGRGEQGGVGVGGVRGGQEAQPDSATGWAVAPLSPKGQSRVISRALLLSSPRQNVSHLGGFKF